MLLPHHGRYPYKSIKSRQDFCWPDQKRLAFHIGLNIEYFAFGTGLSHNLTVPLPAPDQRAYAWADYGNRIGTFRILDLLDEFALPAAHLVNTEIFRHCPDILPAIKARGDEFIGHGRTNAERHGLLWEEDEARFLKEVRQSILEYTGQEVRGWMAPWMSHSAHTPDLLDEAGFKFLLDWPADDQPFWMRTRAGRIMSVPYPLELNDSPQMLVRAHTPDDFAQMVIDQFDEMLDQSKTQPLVFGLALHAMVTGQPYRLRALRRALKYIAEHPRRNEVWFTRPGDIYDHCLALPDGTLG